jgi:hypothetical protein
MNPNIGIRLNAVDNTLTALTGEEDTDDIVDLHSVNIADLSVEDIIDITLNRLTAGIFQDWILS